MIRKIKSFCLILLTIYIFGVIGCDNSYESASTIQKPVIEAEEPKISFISSDVLTPKNNSVILSIIAEVNDEGSLSFQWYKASDKLERGIAVSEEKDGKNWNTKDFIPNLSNAGVFYYYCVIKNTLNSSEKKIVSPRITVTVLECVSAQKPSIIKQPSDVTVVIPGTGVLAVIAGVSDEGELSYQWYLVNDNSQIGIKIENAVNAIYKIAPSTSGRNGYYCVITNTINDNGDGGIKTASITSEIAYIDAKYIKDIIPAPTFIKQPVSMNIAPHGGTVTLSCLAETSDYPVRYKWYGSVDGSYNSRINLTEGEGVETPEYTTPIFTTKGIYYYYCIASSVFASDEGEEVNSVYSVSNIVSVAYTGLPTLYIDTENKTPVLTKENAIKGSFTLIAVGLQSEFKNVIDDKIEIKCRGNSSLLAPKKVII